ncbi:uncharacterized protein LOC132737078 [Ruditapes philippinarum]|uniref:uncharacterized protein LOC132737078 n=1 Tax=Ruditapes philippinarum TaxID=129788 RepID=UPI00295B7F90|nr:uncharacterized protein LOC132737078 [Ruditapes philippinarum]
MGQEHSKPDKEQSENEKNDDKKILSDIEKEKKRRVKECKHEKRSCKTSPGYQETMQSDSSLPARVHSEASLSETDKQNTKRGVQYSEETEQKDTEEHGNKNATKHRHVDEQAMIQYIDKNIEKRMHCLSSKINDCKSWLSDENASKERFDEENMENDVEGKTGENVPVDCKINTSLGKNCSYVTAHSTITRGKSEDVFPLLNKTDEIKGEDRETFANTLKCKERNVSDQGIANRLEELRNKSKYVYLKKCLSIHFMGKGYLSLSQKTASLKTELDDLFLEKSLLVTSNCRTYGFVFALGVPSTQLLHSSGDQRFIKHILKTPHLKDVHLRDEHFRLATFSLSPDRYELGEVLRLSARGFYNDIDGRIRCFSCRNTYKSSHSIGHHANCMQHRHDGTSMSQYGESAHSILLANRNRSHYVHSSSVFQQIRFRFTRYTIRFGETQQVISDNIVTNREEEDDEGISVRQNASLQSQNGQSNTVVSLSESSPNHQVEAHQLHDTTSVQNSEEYSCGYRNAGVFHRRTIDHPSCQHNGSQIQGSRQSENGQRTIKEDVNRKQAHGTTFFCGRAMPHPPCQIESNLANDVSPASNTVTNTESLEEENNYTRSRLWCRKCQRRHCNIVIIPCGHIVVCDNCITNTTECPKCKKMVEQAHRINPSE